MNLIPFIYAIGKVDIDIYLSTDVWSHEMAYK